MQKQLPGEELPAKVDIPGDEDPNSGQEPDETITASSASASVDSSGSGSEISSSTVDSSTSESSVSESTVSESTEGTESSTSEEPEEGSEVSSVDGETDAEEKDSSLKNYEALYQDMLEVTENQNERWLPSSALLIRWTILTRTMKTSSRFPV